MARPSTGANLNISQLEQILEGRRQDLNRLEKQRSQLQEKLDAVEREIARLEGGGGGGAGNGRRSARAGGGRGRRARNDRSLIDTIADVLRQAGGPLKVNEIMEAVRATGYRSNSANFRSIVNQQLIKDRERFGQVERGVYTLKGEGGGKGKKDKPKTAA